MVTKEFLRMAVADLIPYENNPRNIPQEAIDDVAESFRQCGDLDPIEVDENNIILSGHTRRLAAMQIGLEQADVIRYTGLTEDQKIKYRILANKTGEKTSFDFTLLQQELAKIDFGDYDFGFDMPQEDNPDIVEDEYDDTPPEEPVCKPGELWQLGDHRLMVGDSTSVADVQVLLGGGTGRSVAHRSAIQRQLSGDRRDDSERQSGRRAVSCFPRSREQSGGAEHETRRGFLHLACRQRGAELPLGMRRNRPACT